VVPGDDRESVNDSNKNVWLVDFGGSIDIDRVVNITIIMDTRAFAGLEQIVPIKDAR